MQWRTSARDIAIAKLLSEPLWNQVVVERRQRGWHNPEAQARGRVRMEGRINPDEFFGYQERVGGRDSD